MVANFNCIKTILFQADENDPELAYRDISKHGIIQVAGKLFVRVAAEMLVAFFLIVQLNCKCFGASEAFLLFNG